MVAVVAAAAARASAPKPATSAWRSVRRLRMPGVSLMWGLPLGIRGMRGAVLPCESCALTS
ncbi:hypothetical protein [Streptomyces sp. NPDC058739]|uniref:hypothetical protein n=1 Tax=Streptomyces sp. NPDC058739 TaxID=3346618 RepID=UPI0036BFF7B4